MNFIHPTYRKLLVGVIICASMAGSGLFMQQHTLLKTDKLSVVNSGSNTCFQRVTQTFTALMIQDVASGYLANDFMAMTSDCFSEVNKELTHVTSSKSEVSTILTQLVSDTHWFHEKVKKIKDLAKSDKLGLSDSTISEKFSSLETSKELFQQKLLDRQTQFQNSADLWKLLTTVMSLASVLIGFIWLSSARKSKSKINEVEGLAENMLLENDVTAIKVDSLVDMALTEVNLPNTLKVVKVFHEDLIHRLDENKIEEVPTVPKENDILIEKGPVTSLNTIFDIALKGIQNKAFTHGVILDFDLQEDLVVFSDQEGLQQLFFTLINFSIESSLNHNSGRKIVARSRVVGNITNLHFIIQNHCFNANELDFLSNNNSEVTDQNLILIKELISILSLNFSANNKIDKNGNIIGAQLEFSFNSAPAYLNEEAEVMQAVSADQLTLNFDIEEDDSKEESENVESSNKTVTSVIKGSKKEVLGKLREMQDSGH